MLLTLAEQRSVLFFGGKGGVGKTSVAAAVALAEADRGRRVHLVSTDPAHNLGHLFGAHLGDGGTEIAPNLTATEIDPAATTERHLHAVEHQMRRMMPEHLHGEVRAYLLSARTAPGMHEAAILERIAEIATASDHDLVIFDTAPSGHTSRLMSLPETMGMWTESLLKSQQRARRFGEVMASLDDEAASIVGTREPGGAPESFGHARGVGERAAKRARDSEIRQVLLRRRDRFASLRDLLRDGDRSSFVLVLAAERLPVAETIEFHADLTGHGIDVGALVVNKLSPPDGGGLLAARRVHEEEHLSVLAAALPAVPRVEVPLLAEEVVGLGALRSFSSLLA